MQGLAASDTSVDNAIEHHYSCQVMKKKSDITVICSMTVLDPHIHYVLGLVSLNLPEQLFMKTFVSVVIILYQVATGTSCPLLLRCHRFTLFVQTEL